MQLVFLDLIQVFLYGKTASGDSFFTFHQNFLVSPL